LENDNAQNKNEIEKIQSMLSSKPKHTHLKYTPGTERREDWLHNKLYKNLALDGLFKASELIK